MLIGPLRPISIMTRPLNSACQSRIAVALGPDSLTTSNGGVQALLPHAVPIPFLDVPQLARGENPSGCERRTLQASRSRLSSPTVRHNICFPHPFSLFINSEVVVIHGWWPNAGRVHLNGC